MIFRNIKKNKKKYQDQVRYLWVKFIMPHKECINHLIIVYSRMD